MSRIGRLPVKLPKGVTVAVRDGAVTATGPKGSISRPIPELVGVEVGAERVTVTRVDESQAARARHGLCRSLVNNMVTGVSQGFTRRLEIIGVGYKSEVQGRTLVLNLGFSHPIQFAIPEGVSVAVEKGTVVSLSGVDRELVGQTAAVLRGYRPPDSYKGKGVRHFGEVIRLKAGKAGTK
jgi:large subunit ribosomal protein L6